MIAKFWIHLPFDLFMTDEEQLALQIEETEGPYPGIRIKIPVGWGYSDLPDPTGSAHEVSASWINKIKPPFFSENMLADNQRVARVNVLVFEMAMDEFDRSADQFSSIGSPLVKFALDISNEFLARLRVYSRLPQIKPLLVGRDRWYFQFTTDRGTPLPEEEGKRRGGAGGPVKVGEVVFKAELMRTIGSRWNGPEPYVWDQLLLDADSLWPEIGSSIVIASSALETFIAWALETLQAHKRVFSDDFWKWLTKRDDDWRREPSVAEKFDNLLEALTGKSLKSEPPLWQTLTALRKARNSLVHKGTAVIDGKKVDPDKAKSLIDGADKIVRWIEQLLPEEHRRYNKGDRGPASRRLVTPEEAALWYKPPPTPPGEGETSLGERSAPESEVGAKTFEGVPSSDKVE